MDLGTWLDRQEKRQADFAALMAEAGHPMTQSRVSQIVRNGTHALGTALAIERATGGEVTAAELLAPAKAGQGEAA